MCRTPEPSGSDETERGNRAGAYQRVRPRPAPQPGAPTRVWYPPEGASWGAGLRAVSGVLDIVAVLAQDEALAAVARALHAMGF